MWFYKNNEERPEDQFGKKKRSDSGKKRIDKDAREAARIALAKQKELERRTSQIVDVVGSKIVVSTDAAHGDYAIRLGGKIWVDLIETSENNSTSWCGSLDQIDMLIKALQKARKLARST